MNYIIRPLCVLFACFTLSACKIDLSVSGPGKVDTLSGSFHCDANSTPHSDGCTQQYVYVQSECDNYVPGSGVTPANCTVINPVVQATENFVPTNDDSSVFQGWNSLSCFHMAGVCDYGVNNDNPNYQLDITATFEDPTPQAAVYTYNGLGQRSSKTVGGIKTYFVYKTDGSLLGEFDADGNPMRELVYLEGGEPLAMIDSTAADIPEQTHYFVNDHHGQPEMTFTLNPSNGDFKYTTEIVSDAFGGTHGVYSAGPNLVQPLRLPGQYFDKETGYSQNWHRDYDSSTGGNLQSDPIGLAGGINTFVYAEGNPVMKIDPNGLEGFDFPGIGSLPGAQIAQYAAAQAAMNSYETHYGQLKDSLTWQTPGSPDYWAAGFDIYVLSGTFTYTRYGDMWFNFGPNPHSTFKDIGTHLSAGYMLCGDRPSRHDLAEFMTAWSFGVGVYAGVGDSAIISGKGVALELGAGFGGAGVSPGSVGVYGGNAAGLPMER